MLDINREIQELEWQKTCKYFGTAESEGMQISTYESKS
jgi:hypothetical protein